MKFGVEANVLDFDGKTDLCLMDPLPDLRLLGYHKGVLPFGAGDGRFFWSTSFCKKGSYARLTDAILRAFERYPVDALTHPGEYIPVDIRRSPGGPSSRGWRWRSTTPTAWRWRMRLLRWRRGLTSSSPATPTGPRTLDRWSVRWLLRRMQEFLRSASSTAANATGKPP